VRDGDVLFGASETGLYRVDHGAVTVLSNESSFDFGGEYVGYNGVALDASYAYFGEEGAVQAVSKSTGAVTTAWAPRS
jgi:hypothetical protein